MSSANLSSSLPIWDLSRLYQSGKDPHFQQDIEYLKKMAERFQDKYRGQVAHLPADALKDAFKEEGSIQLLIAKLNLFTYLSFTQNTRDPERQALVAHMEELGTEISTLLVFFDLELGEAGFTGREEAQELQEYRYHIEKSVRTAKHNLTEELESFAMEKNLTGRTALVNLFDELFGDFSFQMDTVEGAKTFTEETALSTLHHGNREYRTQVYNRFLDEVGQRKVVLGNIYNNILLDHRLDTKRRGYGALMDPRNESNEVSSDAVQAMLDVVESGYGLARRYFQVKSRLLGLEDFTNADIYAPLTPSSREIEWEDAKKMVLTSYGRFDARFSTMVDDFFRLGRVDAALSEGKRSGAFCYGAAPELDAYVMLNYTKDIRSVQTLAHELGHGIHHQLSKKQNHTAFDTPLTTAETASVFGEILLNELLVEQSNSPTEKLSVLASQMEGIIATVFRQTVLTRFEQRAHEARVAGRVSDEEFCNIWLEENGKLYGDTVKMVDSYKWGWAYIPHFFHTPFYCYAYSFGQLLVLALYHEYKKQGDKFRSGYRELLSLGGSDSPDRLVQKTIGLDINQRSFWEGALGLLEEQIVEIETLAKAVEAEKTNGKVH